MKDFHGIDLDLLFDNESKYGKEYYQGEPRIVRIDNEMDNKIFFVADDLVSFLKLVVSNEEIEETEIT